MHRREAVYRRIDRRRRRRFVLYRCNIGLHCIVGLYCIVCIVCIVSVCIVCVVYNTNRTGVGVLHPITPLHQSQPLMLIGAVLCRPAHCIARATSSASMHRCASADASHPLMIDGCEHRPHGPTSDWVHHTDPTRTPIRCNAARCGDPPLCRIAVVVRCITAAMRSPSPAPAPSTAPPPAPPWIRYCTASQPLCTLAPSGITVHPPTACTDANWGGWSVD
jgi:hypothetical protein